MVRRILAIVDKAPWNGNALKVAKMATCLRTNSKKRIPRTFGFWVGNTERVRRAGFTLRHHWTKVFSHHKPSVSVMPTPVHSAANDLHTQDQAHVNRYKYSPSSSLDGRQGQNLPVTPGSKRELRAGPGRNLHRRCAILATPASTWGWEWGMGDTKRPQFSLLAGV